MDQARRCEVLFPLVLHVPRNCDHACVMAEVVCAMRSASLEIQIGKQALSILSPNDAIRGRKHTSAPHSVRFQLMNHDRRMIYICSYSPLPDRNFNRFLGLIMRSCFTLTN